MPNIAEWNGKRWETSGKKITPLEDLTTGLVLETDTNEDNEGKSPTYNKKFQLQSFSMSTLYSTNVGASPKEEIDSWYALVGEVAPLFIGGKPFGPNEIQLKSVQISAIVLDDYGRIREAKFSFQFEEYAPEKSAEKISENKKAPAAATSKSGGTASSLKPSGASSKDKANWQQRMEADST